MPDWNARLRARKRLLARAVKRLKFFRDLVAKRRRRVRAARERAARQAGPKIINLKLNVRDLFGPLGSVFAVTGHYTAGPRDRSDAEACDLWRRYHNEHAAKGWGGIGYHLGITAAGTLVLLRPVRLKGAHTASHNTGNVGVVVHGTTGDKPTAAQAATFRWLLANAHTSAMPESHRVDLRGKTLRGHKDWPDNATACPGEFHRMYLSGGKQT